MRKKDVKKCIRICLKDIKGDNFEYENNLISGGLISSFEFFELITKLEKNFEIRFPLKSICPENFDSICDIERQIDVLVK